MPESDRPYFGLGRLLPERLRARVFEPAYLDLIARRSRRRGRAGARRSTDRLLALHILALTLECARVGAGESLARDRRLTRTARWAMIVLVATVALGVAGGIAANTYLPPPPG